jgi:hypothetical protein
MKDLSRFQSVLKAFSICAIAAMTLIVGCVEMVWAQAPSLPSSAQVYVGGTFFITLRTTWAGLTPEQRADVVQERINEALSMGPIHPDDISVGQMQGDWVVLLKGRRFFTADIATAKAESTSPQQLAEQWAQHLRHQLPALTYPTNPK